MTPPSENPCHEGAGACPRPDRGRPKFHPALRSPIMRVDGLATAGSDRREAVASRAAMSIEQQSKTKRLLGVASAKALPCFQEPFRRTPRAAGVQAERRIACQRKASQRSNISMPARSMPARWRPFAVHNTCEFLTAKTAGLLCAGCLGQVSSRLQSSRSPSPSGGTAGHLAAHQYLSA